MDKSKQRLFEMMNKVGGMSLNENQEPREIDDMVQVTNEKHLNEMLYHVVNKETKEIIISYDVPNKAKLTAKELNDKYKTDRYVVK